jgi:hypothetical protein
MKDMAFTSSRRAGGHTHWFAASRTSGAADFFYQTVYKTNASGLVPVPPAFCLVLALSVSQTIG